MLDASQFLKPSGLPGSPPSPAVPATHSRRRPTALVSSPAARAGTSFTLMKTILALLFVSFLACLMLPACAQDLAPSLPGEVYGATNLQLTEWEIRVKPKAGASNPVDPLTAQVISLAVEYPWVVGVLALMGALRVIFKPGMVLIRVFVKSTPSPADDLFLDRVEQHPLFGAFGWILDLLASIKLDTVRAALQSRQSRAALLVPAVLTGVLLQFSLGCALKPEAVAYKTVAGCNVAVKTALTAWTDHVVARKAAIAKMSAGDRAEASAELLRQEGQVIIALDNYKRAAASAEVGVNAALDSGATPASAALSAAAAAFVSVVEQLKR